MTPLPLEVDGAIDNLQAEDESPQSAETGDNFTSLQTEIDEGATEITLEKDYARAVGEKDIVIDKDFTIDGQGKYSIHAAESGRIFNVTADHTLTLQGLTLIGGNVNGNGGAVYSEGNLKLINCTFTNNVASMFGGAVFVNGTATIEGCVFKENTALKELFTTKIEKLTVKNTLFDNNTAKGNAGGAITGCGAAIYTYAPLEVHNSNFTANHAEYDGGAIFYRDNEDDAAGVLDNCRFEGNVADGSCGAVYVDGYDKCNFNVTNTKFINNTNKASHSTVEETTAALHFKGANLRVTNTEFINNKGKRSSAIYAVGEAGLLTIDNSQFVENNADDTTVAIYKNAKLTNVRFVSNSGYSDRVAIDIANSGVNVEIKDSTFIDNGNSTEYSIWNTATLKVENNTISNGIGGPGTVIKQNSSVTISPIDNVTYGSPVVVYYTIENRTSNVTVSICYDDEGVQTPVEGVNYTLENDKVVINDLAAGDYVIIIFNNEDNNYELSSDVAFFTVGKVNSSVAIAPVANVTYGESVVVEYTIVNRTNNVTVSICYNDGGLQPPVEGVNYTFQVIKLLLII